METPTPHDPYACSLGTVVNHEDGSYIIATADGRTIGIASAGEPSPANVEADIAASLVPNLSALKGALKARATHRRWEVEVAGITVGDVQVATDDRAKLLLAQADREARRDANYATQWKGEDGVWSGLNAATVIALAEEVSSHVSTCFAREATLHALIDAAADVTALDALKPEIEAFELPA